MFYIKRPILIWVLVYILSIIVSQSQNPYIILIYLCFIAFYLFYILKIKDSKRKKHIIVYSVILLFFVIHPFWVFMHETDTLKEGDIVEGKYIIEAVSHVNFDASEYRLYLKDVDNDKEYLAYSKDPYPYKSIIKVKGSIYDFRKATNEGEYNPQKYYKSIGILHGISITKAEVVKKPNVFYKYIGNLREKLTNTYESLDDKKHSGIYTAMIIGERSALDNDVKDIYTSAGIAHILAISGLHLALIGMSFYRFLRKRGLSYAISAYVSSLFLIMYVIFCGNSMSVRRAAIMMIIYLISEYLNRDYDLINSISIASLIILMDNPYAVTNSGFQLSFSCVIAIGIVAPIIINSLELKKKMLPSMLVTSATITLINLPIIAYNYFYVPTYSILVNFLVIPMMSFIMTGMIAGGLSGLVSVPLGMYMIGISHYGLDICEYLASLSLRLPFSRILFGRPSTGSILVYYIIMMAFIYLLYSKNNISAKHKLYLVLIIPCLSLLLFNRQRCNTYMTMLDVSQGQCIYVNTKNNHIMIDCGSSDVDNVGQKRIVPYLLSNRIDSVDYLFITHCDADHTNALEDLIFSIDIKHVVLSSYIVDDPKTASITNLLKSHNIDIIYWDEYTSLKKDDLFITSFYPLSDSASNEIKDNNELSLCLNITIPGINLIVTGDIGFEAEEYICKEKNVYADKPSDTIRILQVAHHGSRYSSSADFLSFIQADKAFISCGRNNRYGHPSPDTISRLEGFGIEHLCTVDTGQITVIRDKKRELRVKQYKKE